MLIMCSVFIVFIVAVVAFVVVVVDIHYLIRSYLTFVNCLLHFVFASLIIVAMFCL